MVTLLRFRVSAHLFRKQEERNEDTNPQAKAYLLLAELFERFQKLAFQASQTGSAPVLGTIPKLVSAHG